jgi:nucleotide-binding universal stress UspA family protein
MYDRILVAVDATPETQAVLARTSALARLSGATVRVLHVRTVDVVDGAGIGAFVEEETEDEATEVVRDAVGELRRQGVGQVEGWSGETVRGDVANTVIAQVKDFGADVLVLGARRHGGLASLFLGSVSDTIVHRAPCAVLLVPEEPAAQA